VNWPKLQEVKRTFDPDHFFRHAMWPLPENIDKGKQRAQNQTTKSTPKAEPSHNGNVLSETVIMPTIVTGGNGPSAATASDAIVTGIEDGLAKNRQDALRATPLSGVQEHKANVPSENMSLDETIRAAASSS
jgi:hypothetical protein